MTLGQWRFRHPNGQPASVFDYASTECVATQKALEHIWNVHQPISFQDVTKIFDCPRYGDAVSFFAETQRQWTPWPFFQASGHAWVMRYGSNGWYVYHSFRDRFTPRKVPLTMPPRDFVNTLRKAHDCGEAGRLLWRVLQCNDYLNVKCISQLTIKTNRCDTLGSSSWIPRLLNYPYLFGYAIGLVTGVFSMTGVFSTMSIYIHFRKQTI